MNKRVIGLIVFGIILMTASFAVAVNETNQSLTNFTTGIVATSGANSGDKIDKAYSCLDNKVKDNTQLSFQEAIFATLALGSKSNLNSKIEGEKGVNCWPKAGCRIKETAQGLMAYKRVGTDTKKVESWLNGKNISASDLAWYLQIDVTNHNISKCTINYDGHDNVVNVKDDMRISNGAGSCLSVSSSGFWLRIANSCLDKEFSISCDQDFVTNLLYQRNGGETVFVSSVTHSAASLGSTKEKVDSKCFANTNTCDYEGTLWAAYALSKAGYDTKSYLPYLLALADDNQKYFPSAFLYALTGSQDEHSNVVQSQRQSKYWEITSSPNNRFFDTALAMLSLQGTSDQELENAKNYLLSIQTQSGCWNNDNIRDTGFILYAGWPKAVAGSGTSTSSALCTSASSDYSCARVSQCLESSGQVLYNFECQNANEFCCSVKAQEQTCSAKKGLVCLSTQRCSGTSTTSADGDCCIGACVDAAVENQCESSGQGICRSACGSDEDAISGISCGSTAGLCCTPKTVSSGGSLLWLWIVLLIILIAVVALAIVYRDKLRMWWYQYRGNMKSKPVERKDSGFSGFNPSMNFGGPRPRAPPTGFAPSRPAQRPVERKAKDNEMEDTFKKLREMSK